MESHPLNLAHQQHRRAEAHLKYHRFDEAMQCHHNAAELLLDAMKSTTSSVALESISLQHSYHLKQKDLIKNRKEQYIRVKKAVDHQKQMSKDDTIPVDDKSKIQVAIYKTINKCDLLLNNLTNSNSTDNNKNQETDLNKDLVDSKIEIRKSSIDEIQILNQNLQSLVEQLVMQTEALKDDNLTLKERVNYLEKERNKYLNLQSPDFIQNNFNNLSLGSDCIYRDTGKKDVVPTAEQNKVYVPSRPIQQPHFDLSAFKND